MDASSSDCFGLVDKHCCSGPRPVQSYNMGLLAYGLPSGMYTNQRIPGRNHRLHPRRQCPLLPSSFFVYNHMACRWLFGSFHGAHRLENTTCRESEFPFSVSDPAPCGHTRRLVCWRHSVYLRFDIRSTNYREITGRLPSWRMYFFASVLHPAQGMLNFCVYFYCPLTKESSSSLTVQILGRDDWIVLARIIAIVFILESVRGRNDSTRFRVKSIAR